METGLLLVLSSGPHSASSGTSDDGRAVERVSYLLEDLDWFVSNMKSELSDPTWT